ncbi:hypothetical protein ACO2Q3_03435 [Caulobacter sp. KR2-114]|uniref:hypothetical protein n=1 Tax=Caulobacter sp. KR2-114 TaxID=3400912 RepID=UPI003BFD831A
MLYAILAAAAIAAAAPPPPAAAPHWLCQGKAKGLNGAEVTANWTVDDSKTVLERRLVWTPPQTSQHSLPGYSGNPYLSVLYDTPDGPPAAVRAIVIGRDGPGPLAGANVSLALKGGQSWSARVIPLPGPDLSVGGLTLRNAWLANTHWSGAAAHLDLLQATPGAHEVTVTLASANGEFLAWITSDLSAGGDRDRLFHDAIAAADALAANPQSCRKAPA